MSAASMVILAIYSMPGRRLTTGFKVAAVPVQVTMPATGIGPVDVSRVKVVTVIVSGSITSLKVTLMSVSLFTSVALSTGLVELTVGLVMSSDIPTVKLQVLAAANELSDTSLAAVVMVAV